MWKEEDGKNVEPSNSPAPGSVLVPTFAVPKKVTRSPSKRAIVPLKGAGLTRSIVRSTTSSLERSPRSKNPVAHRTRTKQANGIQGTLRGYVTSSGDNSWENSPAAVRRKVTDSTVRPPNTTRTVDKAATSRHSSRRASWHGLHGRPRVTSLTRHR